MFISKKEHKKIVKAKEREITELINKVKKQEESMEDLKRGKDNEHLKKCKYLEILLAIKRLVINFDYRQSNSINVIRKINNELDNLHID